MACPYVSVVESRHQISPSCSDKAERRAKPRTNDEKIDVEHRSRDSGKPAEISGRRLGMDAEMSYDKTVGFS